MDLTDVKGACQEEDVIPSTRVRHSFCWMLSSLILKSQAKPIRKGGNNVMSHPVWASGN